jgi:serine protease Do
MKWLPTKGPKNRRFRDLEAKKHLLNFKPQATMLVVCITSMGMFLSGDASQFKAKTFASVSPQKLPGEINRIAASISVKIMGKGFLGSGFIVQQQGEKYAVLTNQHVLRAGELPYRIQTPDGKTHDAEVVSDLTSTEYDLALLQFKASDIGYHRAVIGNSLYLEVGESIFAAGFPDTELETKTPAIFEQQEQGKLSGLALKPGRIAIILNKALEEGYQIGYTNDVKKGMSGGPLLNSRGEVIGVNGKHAYPLWDAPELYQDGSEPCPALQKLITRSSLAIPIEKSIELAPQLKSLRLPADDEATHESSLSSTALNSATSDDSIKLVIKMQAEAAKSENCQEPKRDLPLILE